MVTTSRLEAFTDAVIAIVMTLLVIEIPEPESGDLTSLFGDGHRILLYVVSFLLLAVYWNNHHHLFQAAKRVDGRTLWANNFFILSLSAFPFVTNWVGDYFFDLAPQALFGLVIMIADILFLVLTYQLRRTHARNKKFRDFLTRSIKSVISIVINVIAIVLGLLTVPIVIFIINAVALLMWVVPDERFGSMISEDGPKPLVRTRADIAALARARHEREHGGDGGENSHSEKDHNEIDIVK
jgi:uncharacterized membrane protein